jgi:hypothetical protein
MPQLRRAEAAVETAQSAAAVTAFAAAADVAPIEAVVVSVEERVEEQQTGLAPAAHQFPPPSLPLGKFPPPPLMELRTSRRMARPQLQSRLLLKRKPPKLQLRLPQLLHQ